MYRRWLQNEVIASKVDHSYILLTSLLDSIDFYAICNDDYNRAEDGISIRKEYIKSEGRDPVLYHEVLYKGPCSVLECLIGIAKRMDYVLYDPEVGENWQTYFWELIENLGLDIYEDARFIDEGAPNKIRQILIIWMSHKYRKNGVGSIFPMEGLKVNMRDLAINEQMNLYLEGR